jgi:hypothetical protein
VATTFGRRLRSLQILRHRLRRDHRQRDVHGAQLALHRPEKGGRITLRPGNDGRRHEARLRVRAVELGRLSSEDVIRGETPRACVRYVLQFQPDPVAAVRELARHLQPGGMVAFHEVD